MSVFWVLAIILFVLMKIVGGDKGTNSFVALGLNFGILFLTVLLLIDQKSIILITFVSCILISCVNLFFINGWNQKTIAAFIATFVTLLILLIFIYWVMHTTMIQGFGEEQIEELSTFSFYVGIDFIKIGVACIMMGMIGAITDTSMAIASSMNEVFQHHPNISSTHLFKSGMNVGGDILGTTTNTLLFAFIGGYLALIIWFKDLAYSFGTIVNSKVFSSEIISALFIGSGAILIIPVTALIMTYYLKKSSKV